MKITNLTTAIVEANFDWILIKVETDEGIIGYGEAFFGPGITAIIRDFRCRLIGEDPTSLDRLVRRLRAGCAHCSPGLTIHAICGIETALLDVLGKKLRVPVWQILGGKYRDAVRIYADCHAGDALESINCLLAPRTPCWEQSGEQSRLGTVSMKHHGWDASKPENLTDEAYAKQAVAMASRGFRILKFDVDVPTPYETDEYNRDLSGPEVEFAASLVRSVREAVGPEIELAIDCHWNYGVQAAIALGRALEPAKLSWYEDPVPPENIAAMAEVQRNILTPVATGENHYQLTDFERLITEGGLRVLAPDVQKIGLWEGRKVALLADRHYVNLTLHNISSPIGTMAGVHLCAAIPNVLALEWHAASVPFFDALVRAGEGPLIRGGKILVPDGPGLGIDLNEDTAWEYRRVTEPFFE
jgi:L-alanine-DL-glutamate epimerase-like enolase superfamily enzyme